MEREEYEAWAKRREMYAKHLRRGKVRRSQWEHCPRYLIKLAIDRGLHRRAAQLTILGHDPVYRQPSLRVVAFDFEKRQVARFYDLEEVEDCDFRVDKVVQSIEARYGLHGDTAPNVGPMVKRSLKGGAVKTAHLWHVSGPGVEQGWTYRGLHWFYENPYGGLI